MSGNVPTSHQIYPMFILTNTAGNCPGLKPKISSVYCQKWHLTCPDFPSTISTNMTGIVQTFYQKCSVSVALINVETQSQTQTSALTVRSYTCNVDMSCMVSSLWCIHRWASVVWLVGLQKHEVPSFLSWRLRRGSLCLCCWPHNLGKLTA